MLKNTVNVYTKVLPMTTKEHRQIGIRILCKAGKIHDRGGVEALIASFKKLAKEKVRFAGTIHPVFLQRSANTNNNLAAAILTARCVSMLWLFPMVATCGEWSGGSCGWQGH